MNYLEDEDMRHIQEILKSESEAEKILIKAQKQSEKIISKAKQDALEKVSNGKKNVDSNVDEKVQVKVVELEKEQERILKEADRKVTDVDKLALKNLDKAKKLLLDAVVAQGE